MASAMLFAGVLAVISAIMGGQKKAFEAQRRMEAALVAEELMGDIATLDASALAVYPTLQNVGSFLAVTTKSTVDEDLPGLSVVVRGTQVQVKIVPSMSEITHVLAEAELFIPEPPS